MTDGREPKKRPAGYRGALHRYLESIRKFEFLTPSGEYRIASRVVEQDQGARNALVEANLRYVVKIAHEYRHYGTPLEDLISEGNIGLLEAARRFDPSRRVRFTNYAAWWIRKYMVAALSRNVAQGSSLTPAPSGEKDDEGGPPSIADPAGRTPPTERRRATRQRLISLEAFTRSDGDRGILEKLAATVEDPDELILQQELADAIRAILPFLPKQERLILTTRYGLDGDVPLTLHEIGRALGCTRERVRQLEVKALARSRRLLLARRPRRS